MSANEKYAGDNAWTEWFELCSVARCQPEPASKLNDQIRSAMYSQLTRFGYTSNTVGNDDPVTFFDSFFLMKGSRDTNKPLKSYFKYRIGKENTPLREFICGTIFSAQFGRIHDIVRDWIASVKGWKPHSLLGEDGKRHLQWERATASDDAREYAGGYVPAPEHNLDHDVLAEYVHQMLDVVSKKIKVEKRKIAFLLLSTAKGLAVSSPEVLAALGVKKSRASKIKEECMKAVVKYFADKEVETNDVEFAGIMISVCEAEAEKEVRHG